MAGWKIHHEWLRWMDPIENDGFFFQLAIFSVELFFQHNPSDKNANPTKPGERMGTCFFVWNLPKWTLVGNLVDFDLLSLESFSNIFLPDSHRITLFQALRTAGSACRCQPDPGSSKRFQGHLSTCGTFGSFSHIHSLPSCTGRSLEKY